MLKVEYYIIFGSKDRESVGVICLLYGRQDLHFHVQM
jgi:hypothetical protein